MPEDGQRSTEAFHVHRMDQLLCKCHASGKHLAVSCRTCAENHPHVTFHCKESSHVQVRQSPDPLKTFWLFPGLASWIRDGAQPNQGLVFGR